MGMAQITLIGNLGRDPEMNYTSAGVSVTKFSIAVSVRKGERETTTWYNCTAFRGLAETLNTHLRKGQQVFIQGEFSPREYTGRDNLTHMSLDVIVDKFQFLGSKPVVDSEQVSSAEDTSGELEEHPF